MGRLGESRLLSELIFFGQLQGNEEDYTIQLWKVEMHGERRVALQFLRTFDK